MLRSLVGSEMCIRDRLFTKKSIPIPGDGSLITQLGHVSDLTDVMIRCINFENSKNNIYNCSGEKGVTIKGLIHFCANVLGLNQNDISGRELEQTKLLLENLDNSFQRYIYVSSQVFIKIILNYLCPKLIQLIQIVGTKESLRQKIG